MDRMPKDCVSTQSSGRRKCACGGVDSVDMCPRCRESIQCNDDERLCYIAIHQNKSNSIGPRVDIFVAFLFLRKLYMCGHIAYKELVAIIFSCPVSLSDNITK